MSEESNQQPSPTKSILVAEGQTQSTDLVNEHPLKMPETYDRIQGYSTAQQQQMAQWEVDAGRLSLEEANELLKNNNVEPIFRHKEAPNPTAAAIDKDFPPAQPNEFKIPQLGDAENPASIQEIKAVSTAVRDWMSTARFPKELGNYVIKEVTRVDKDYAKMTPDEQASWSQKQQSILRKMWGSEYKQKLAFANKLVKELDQKRPGLIKLLDQTGAGDSAAVVAQFALQAERLYFRLYRDRDHKYD
jgi:hypothetical protein